MAIFPSPSPLMSPWHIAVFPLPWRFDLFLRGFGWSLWFMLLVAQRVYVKLTSSQESPIHLAMSKNQGSFRWFGMVSNWDCISSSCFIWFFVIVLFGGMSQNTSNKYVAGFLCYGTSKMLTDTVAILKCCKCQSSSNWRSRLDGWICSEQNIGQSWSYLRGYATFVCVWTLSGQVNEQFCS